MVRQTTVLIAQMATTAGARAPLAHTANSVFLDLARELKQQGLGSKVISDMFGLTLRAYDAKVARLTESGNNSVPGHKKHRRRWRFRSSLLGCLAASPRPSPTRCTCRAF